MLSPLVPLHIGRTEYARCWQLQNHFHELRVASKVPDLLLLTQHQHTYTTGRRDVLQHLLLTPEELQRRGIAFHRTDRGGDITYHGPGQLVGYPILALQATHGGVVGYLRRLELALIEVLASIGVDSHVREGLTGVWTRRGKIASIGVRISGGVTLHGFALNVDPDLGYFDGIVPCGIDGCSMTSVLLERQSPVSIESLLEPITASVARHLGMHPEPGPQQELFQQVSLVLNSTADFASVLGPGAPKL